MRDPNRILPLLSELADLWLENPDLRLAQLILNAEAPYKYRYVDLYNVEDDVLLERLKELYK